MANPFAERPVIEVPEDFTPSPRLDWDTATANMPVRPAPLAKEKGYFGRRIGDVVRSIDQLQGAGYGALGAIGSAMGIEPLQEFGIKGFTRNEREAQYNPPSFNSFTEVDWTSPTDIFEFGSQAIAENLVQFAPAIVTGGIGGAIGTQAAKKIGTQLMTEWAEKFGAEQAAKMVAKRIAIGSGVGQALGAQISSSTQETGSIYGELAKQGDPDAGWIALGTGQVAGALDAIPQFMILRKTLGPAVAERIADYTIKSYGKSIAEQIFAEMPTEMTQTIIEKTAQRIADPARGEFTGQDWTEVIDSGIRAAFGAAGTTAVLEAKPAIQASLQERVSNGAIRPSPNPLVNQAGEDIERQVESFTFEEPTTEDEAVVNLATTLGQETPQVEIPQQEIPTEVEQPIEESPTLQEQPEAFTQNLQLESNQVEQQIQELDQTFEQTENIEDLPPGFQERRKQLLERRGEIEAQLAGIEPQSTAPLRETPQPSRISALLERDKQVQEQRIGERQIKDITAKLSIGRANPQNANRIRNSYRTSLLPYSPLIGSLGVKLAAKSSPNQDKMQGETLTVSWDDDANINLQLVHPENIQSDESNIDSIVNDILPKKIEEEIDHIGLIQALKEEWQKKPRGGFKKFVNKRLGDIAQDIKFASSDRTLKAQSFVYTKIANKRLSDREMAIEFLRQLTQRVRTGKITEDVQLLADQKALGNRPASRLLQRLLDSLRILRNALARFANRETAPKRITELLDKTNEVLDRFKAAAPSLEQVEEIPLEEAPVEETAEEPPETETASSPRDLTPRQQKLDKDFGTGLGETIQSIAHAEFPDDTEGKPRVSGMADFIGDYAPANFRQTRSLLTNFDNINDFLNKNGFLQAADKILMNKAKGLHAEERVGTAMTLYQAAEGFKDSIRSKRMPSDERLKLINQINATKALLQNWLPAQAENDGRSLRIIAAFRETLDGYSLQNDHANMIFNIAQQIEPNMQEGSFSDIAESVREDVMKNVPRATKSKKFLTFVNKMLRESTQDPEKLFRRLMKTAAQRKSMSKGVERAAARAAMDMMGPSADDHLRNVARSITTDISAALSPNADADQDATDVFTKAFTKFAKDFLPNPPAKKTQEGIKLAVLKEMLVNDKQKDRFVDILSEEIVKKFPQGKKDPAYLAMFPGIFDAMKEAGWSERMRDDAIRETLGIFGLTLPKLIRQGWDEMGGNIEKVKDLFRKKLGDAIPKETLNNLLSDVQEAIETEAIQHLEDTFKFKRTVGPDGKITYESTQEGGLKGGQAVRDALRLADVSKNLTDVTKMGYGESGNFIANLAQRYIEELGIPAEYADKLQQIFQEELRGAVEFTRDKNLQSKIQSLTGKLADQKKAPKDTKGIFDKLADMAMQGYVGNEAIYESIRSQYNRAGLPQWKPELSEWLKNQADELRRLPEGSLKNEQRQKIANVLANMTGISTVDKITTWWYFCLLSGPTTFLVTNPGANLANLLLNSTIWGAQNPKRIPKIISAFTSSVVGKSRAWDNFWQVMETGFAPTDLQIKYSLSGPKNKIIENAALPVERATPETGWFFNKLVKAGIKIPIGKRSVELSIRGLQRFMMATDQFFRSAGYEVALASQGVEATAEMQQKAIDQATAEFGLGLDRGKNDERFRIRVNEILDQLVTEKNPFAVKRAHQRALEVAFTQEPKGAIGALAKQLGTWANSFPLMRTVLPFTNVVANVWNEAVNYTPWGLFRYGVKGNGEWRIEDENGNPIRDSTLLIKALTGMALTSALLLLGDDDDNDEFELYGNGPDDPDLRRAWLEKGGKPYTIRVDGNYISYMLTPSNLPLAIAGSILDMKRSGKMKEKGLQDIAAATAASSMVAVFSQSFLSGVTNVLDIINSKSPGEALKKYVGNQIGSAVAPNLIKKVGQWTYDDTLYEGNTVQAYIVKNIPGINANMLEPALNVFAEPIHKNEYPILGRNFTIGKGDPVINFYYERGIRIPGYDRSFPDASQEDKRKMIEMVGPKLKTQLERMQPTIDRLVRAGKKEEAQDLVTDIATDLKRAARNQVKRQTAANF